MKKSCAISPLFKHSAIRLSTGYFNIHFNDGGTLSLISLLESIQQYYDRCAVAHFWDKNCNWNKIERQITADPDVSEFLIQEDIMTFQRNRLWFMFIRAPFPIGMLYSQQAPEIKSELVDFMRRYIDQWVPRLVFTTQYDLFSMEAARDYPVFHFIRSMEPIEFQFSFPYKMELIAALARVPVSVSSVFLQTELKQAYGINSFVLYPIVDTKTPDCLPSAKEWITLINFLPQKGGYLFFLLSCLFREKIFVAVSGKKTFFNKLNRPLNPNLVFINSTPRIYRIYSRTRILLVPSIVKDACPRVIFEAMSYSIPILANRIGGIPEIIPDDQNLVDIQNCAPEQVIQAYSFRLRRLLHEPEYYERSCQISRQNWLKWRGILEKNFLSFIHRVGLL